MIKKVSVILTVVLFSLQLYSVTSTCGQLYPVTFTTTTAIACTANQILTPTDFPNFPGSGTRKLFFAFTLENTASCGGVTESYIMALYTQIAGTDTFIFGFKLGATSISAYYNQNGAEQSLATFNTAGSKARLGIWIDLDDSLSNHLKIAGVVGNSFIGNPYSFTGDLSAWTFDSNTKIYLNSGSDSVTAYSVLFSDLSVGYEMQSEADAQSQARDVLDRTIPIPTASEIFASYDSSTLSGTSLPDSTSKLGTAYLGLSSSDSTNAPVAVSTGGLNFSTIAQQITLPKTAYTGNLGTNYKYAMTVSFMIKLSALPANTETIVSRKKSDGTEIFSVKLLANNTIVPSYSGVSLVPATEAVALNTWTLVTVQIVAFDTGSAVLAAATITQKGKMVSIKTTPTDATATIASPQSDSNTDTFTIGGFIGLLKSFSLTYRGQGMIIDGSCTTNCLYVMGPYTPTCILSTCTTSQYKDGDLCTACSTAMSNCATCSGASTCTQCTTTGFVLKADNSGCQPCSTPMSNCATCSSTSTCTQCAAGFVLKADNSGCTACSATMSNCAACSSASTCTTCATGYTVNVTNAAICQSCSATMANCTACSGPNTCTQCATGFSVNATNNGCQSCSAMANCATCSGPNTCTKCAAGFGVKADNSGCITCSVAMDNCTACSGPTACTQCATGFTLKADKTGCVACSASMTNCSTCSSTSICTQCNVGFALTTDKSACSACSGLVNKCMECYINGTTTPATNVCTACTGFYQPITSGTTTSCGCPAGRYETSAGCLSCYSNIKNCALCSGASTCTKCASNYVLNSAGNCTCPSGMVDTRFSCQAPEAESSGLSGGAIAGIVIGAIAVLVLPIVIIKSLNGKSLKE